MKNKLLTINEINFKKENNTSMNHSKTTNKKRMSIKSIKCNLIENKHIRNEYKNFYGRNYNLKYIDDDIFNYLKINHKSLINNESKCTFIKRQKSNTVKKDIKNRTKNKTNSIYDFFKINNLKNNKEKKINHKKFIIVQIYIVVNDFIQVLLAIASSIIYIMLTIYDIDKQNNKDIINLLDKIEIFIMVFVTLDFIIHFYNEIKNIKYFFLKIMNIIDFVTIWLFYISLFDIWKNKLGFLQILQIFRMLRIFRIFRLFNDYNGNKFNNYKKLNNPIYAYYKQITITFITLTIILFIYSSILLELNNLIKLFIDLESDNSISFFNIFYILLLYIFTLGFTDIYPNSYLSRIIILIFFFNFYIILIYDLNKIITLKKRLYTFSKSIYFNNHYIICGFYNLNIIKRVINIIYKIDKKAKILIVSQTKFNENIINLINQNFYLNKIKLLYNEDLYELFNNGNFIKCKSVIMLNNYYVLKNKTIVDDYISFFCKNIYDYYENINLKIQIFDSKDKKILNLYTKWSPLIDIFTTNNIKISLITNSIFSPSITTLFNNLIKNKDNIENKNINDETLIEYNISLQQSLYFIKLNQKMKGFTFKEINKYFYNFKNNNINNLGIILIGIKTFLYNHKGEILVNPINYRINEDDIGIFIYSDKDLIINSIIEFKNNFKKSTSVLNKNNNESIENIENYFNEFNMEMSRVQEEFEKINENYSKYLLKLDKNKKYKLYRDDLSQLISYHIIVFGPIDYLEWTIKIIRSKTLKPICYLTDKKYNQEFEEIKNKYDNVIYFKGNIFNIKHWKNASIENCFYLIIYSEINEDSIFNDSNTLLIINIIKNNFPNINYVYEIYNKKLISISDESKNKKNSYFKDKVFFNSFLDKLLLSSIKNKFLCEFIHSFLKKK